MDDAMDDEPDDDEKAMSALRREEIAWARAGYTEGYAEGAAARGHEVEEAARTGFDEGLRHALHAADARGRAQHAAQHALEAILRRQRLAARDDRQETGNATDGAGGAEETEKRSALPAMLDEQLLVTREDAKVAAAHAQT